VAVILPDGSYSVRKRPHEFGRDAHGTPLPTSPGPAVGPGPGDSTEQQDGTWTLRLDPAAWRVRPGDLVDGPAGRTWVVATALLKVNNAAADVDYVAVTAQLEPPERI
jgi:hypothetical protein